MKYTFFIIIIIFFSKYKSTSIFDSIKEDSFIIDSSISLTAKTKIRETEFGSKKYSFMAPFESRYFTNDTLVFSGSREEQIYARYYFENDTLHIAGGPTGMSGGGFHAVITGKEKHFYHFNCGHTKRRLKKSITDSTEVCVDVECNSYNFIISDIPDSTKDNFIYGFVEFKSNEYFYEEKHMVSRLRQEMRFYFRAYNFHFSPSYR